MEELFFCPNCMAKTAAADCKCPVCGSSMNVQNAPHQLPVNTILNGRYLIGKVLGAGGFGITYIGYDLKLDSKVAVKEYYPSGAANRSSSLTVFPTTEVNGNPFEIGKNRFLKEAKTLSEFVGEGNIVTLRDYFEENGTAYIVMEYLEGEDLSHYAKKHGVFGLDEALDLLEPAMLALDKIHKKGLIHRDISPSNIMVLSDGRVKVLDFGSARLQNTSGELSLSVMLKPGYAPMEQYSTHGEQGSWTDVYAMSATIYKLITGKTPPASTDRLMEDTIELPSSLGVKITPEQEAALLRGLALRPADRTQTMAELAESLRVRKNASPKKSAKPVVDLKKKPAPEETAKSKNKEVPAREPDKKVSLEKPAKTEGEKKKPKKHLPIICAAVLALLVLVLAVPAMKNTDTAAVPAAATETPAAKPAANAKSARSHFDKLTLEFVPSKDADVIITGTKDLPELVKAEMANLGYDIDEVDITVGTSYDATGEAMSAGSIDLGWLPGGTYALYSDDVDVILTATRNGLSNDSTDPAAWNGEANATQRNGPQIPYYRSLIYATPSKYGKELAAKAAAGEKLTWEDLDKAKWAVQKTSSSAGYIYPSMWLMENYDGKKISDLSNVIPLDSGYGTAFSYAAAEQVDIIVCYADGRNDYEASWMLPTDQQDETGKQGMGRSDSIWNELNVIGVTEGIYNDTVAISKESQYYTPELVAALQDCFINIINTDEGQAIFSVYSHTGYAKAVDSDYDGARAAMTAVSD